MGGQGRAPLWQGCCADGGVGLARRPVPNDTTKWTDRAGGRGWGRMDAPMDATRHTRASLAVLVATLPVAALLGACGTGPTPGATASHGLVQASAGLCQALGDLPDTQAASRTFTNLAHDQLHRLAADQRLDRSLQASVLQAMQDVEADFSQSVGAGVLYGHLGALKDRTDQALQALGEEVPSCGS